MEKNINCSADKEVKISLEVNIMDYLEVTIRDNRNDRKEFVFLDLASAKELRDGIDELLKKLDKNLFISFYISNFTSNLKTNYHE